MNVPSNGIKYIHLIVWPSSLHSQNGFITPYWNSELIKQLIVPSLWSRKRPFYSCSRWTWLLILVESHNIWFVYWIWFIWFSMFLRFNYVISEFHFFLKMNNNPIVYICTFLFICSYEIDIWFLLVIRIYLPSFLHIDFSPFLLIV